MVKKISEDESRQLKRVAADSNPELIRLAKIDPLGQDPERRLTEISNTELVVFDILESMHNNGFIEIPATMEFFHLIRVDRVSLDRKGRDEYIKAIIGQPIPAAQQYGAPGTVDQPQEKKGIFSRFRRG